ncbi:MAG: hemerythrin domain-containing protein [Aquabacterium sp.]|jgi:hemerythrin-like domain-containing protein|nr:MAG: hemerythrin domain-containing protein [Aquabacterium sp.]
MPASKRHSQAIALLIADHVAVKKLFRQYDELAEAKAEAGTRRDLARRICNELKVHTRIEEEILYPAAREALGEEADLVDEAQVEHASAKDLIAQIESMEPDQPLYDAKVKVLGEYIEHHVQEEQQEMFPKLEESRLDLDFLGEQIAVRKQEIKAEIEQLEPEPA